MYKIEIPKKAQKELRALPLKDQQRIVAAFEQLRLNPFTGKKLRGRYEGAWSLRVWLYRILYAVNQDTEIVLILKIGHRQGVYKR